MDTSIANEEQDKEGFSIPVCPQAYALDVCEPVSDAREPVSAFCAGKRFPGGGDGRCLDEETAHQRAARDARPQKPPR